MAAKSLSDLLRQVDVTPLLHAATVQAHWLSQSPEATERDYDLLLLVVMRMERSLDHLHLRLYGKTKDGDGN